MKPTIKRLFIVVFVGLTIGIRADAQTAANQPIFPKGEKAQGSFTGTVWMSHMVSPDSTFNFHMANVTFGPGARTYWHTHPGGQVLLVIKGSGYYQEKGQVRRELKPGDIIKCLPNVEHWHGATAKEEFAHVGISNRTTKGTAVWLQPVTDEEYNVVK